MSTVVNKIENILTSEYTTANFVELMQEIFDSMKLVAPNNFRPEFSNFSNHIKGSIHVGNYAAPDKKRIAIFAVQLKKDTYVENSRSTQRSYAKKLIEGGNCDAAIVAFFTDSDPKWRLSFVRLDYEMKFEHGKLKQTENLTPAKRYSFLVGKNEPCHTAVDRFRHFIITQNFNPSLDDLEEAFSVEKVTDEFFNLYCEKFHQLREKLESIEDFCIEADQHNFSSAQFAKKLMGQIVFLYFLQKKGWLGVGAWPNTLTEKEYKNAFYARGAKSRELIPVVYRPVGDGTYRISSTGLQSISDADEEVLAQCVKGRPWGTGPHNFMRKLFELSERRGNNFYNDILEPLFYDALNRNRGEQGYCPALHCRIPFLSGGLFEPIDGYDWEHNDFIIPNDVFSNASTKGRDADGILDIFDRYNFTMSEDEPMEREVAIDPEMLGKVFENLLEVNDRKSKGAFYTPREIVHYMCQESLISYLVSTVSGVGESDIRDFILYGDFMKDEDTLKTLPVKDSSGKIHMEFDFNKDMKISENILSYKKKVNRLREIDDALKNVRVADPAVGSGAFPLGMLNEIVRARQNISAYMAITMKPYDVLMMYRMERSPHTMKYETIRNCIFAADIEPSAVDIAQLRLWLALVIDDEINPNAQTPLDGHKNPLPLPNLESNILCGNSLVDEFEGVRLIKDSALLGNDTAYQIDLNSARFDSVVNQLMDKQDELFRCDDTEKKRTLKAEIDALRNMIIMVQLEGCSSDMIARYQESSKMASRPYVLWQLDFARVFREKGGFDIVIGNPPYVNVEKMPNRELVFKLFSTCVGRTDLYVAFIQKGSSLLRKNGSLSFIIPYAYTNQNYGQPSREMLIDNFSIDEIVDTSNYLVFDTAMVKNIILRFSNKHSTGKTKIKVVSSAAEFALQQFNESIIDQNVFSNIPGKCFKTNGFQNTTQIKEKVDARAIPLEMLCLIAYGVRVNSKTDKSKPKSFYLKESFEDGLKPFIEGRNIQRYQHQQNGWLNYSPSEHYNPMFPELFENEKIIFIRVVSERLRFSYDDNGLYNSHTVINCVRLDKLRSATHSSAKKVCKACKDFDFVAQYDMKFILGILNSKLINWYFMTFISDGLNFYPDNAKQLPIIDLSKENVSQEEIVSMVEQVLDNKAKGLETLSLENQIDKLVYEMYGLTEDEIKIVEDNNG